jgi:phospholipid/cholesterol/gamma-HCH transport system substrate-binding protein
MTSSVIRRRERSDLIRFSIFLLIAGMFTYWVGVVTAAARPGDRVEYKAVFGDVSGLGNGDAVRIAGVDVGKVTDIAVQEDSSILVTFNVPKDQHLNTSTEATIQYRNLIGDRIIQLARPDENAKRMSVGDTIPLAQTRPALDLDTLLNGFRPLFAGLTPSQINAFSGDLIKVLQGQSSAVATLVERAGSFTSTIGDRQQLVGQVIRNLNTVVGTFDSRRDNINVLITELSKLVDGLESQDTQVLDAASRIDGVAKDASSLVASARTNLQPDLVELARAARGLNQSQDTLVSVLQKLPVHYAAIQNAASYGNFFNFFLCGVRIQTGGLGEPSIRTPWIYSDVSRCKR